MISLTWAISSSSTLGPPMLKNGIKQLGFFPLRVFRKGWPIDRQQRDFGCGDLQCGPIFAHLNFALAAHNA